MKEIEITQGFTALVDDEDFEEMSKFNWHIHKPREVVYVMRHILISENRKEKRTYLHREILKVQPHEEVDHRDGNGLNNVRSNLRVATKTQNNRNRGLQRNNVSGFKGVSLDKRNRKWRAVINVDKSHKFLGYFKTPEEAYSAYCAAAIFQHKEFARLK